jgi:RND superfamily putative drug exporter
MVLLWIVSAVVIIGLGKIFAGEYEADYNTPGSESKEASELAEREFGGYSGQEIYVVWKDPAGADSPAARERMNAFFAAAERVRNVERRGAIRLSQDGTIATTTLPLNVPGWEVKKEQGEALIDAAEANSGGGLRIELGDPFGKAPGGVDPDLGQQEGQRRRRPIFLYRFPRHGKILLLRRLCYESFSS